MNDVFKWMTLILVVVLVAVLVEHYQGASAIGGTFFNGLGNINRSILNPTGK